LIELSAADLIIALLCGNFNLDEHHTRSRVHDALMLAGWDVFQLQSQLRSIMNPQTALGTLVSIPAVFFLGGFIYNALGINTDSAIDANWVPLAIFWMVLLLMAVLSVLLLAGNNPSSLSVLMHKSTNNNVPRPWWMFLKDYHKDELHPDSVWARGHSNRRWVEASDAVQRHASLRQALV
jgi:hypothetical protein